MGYKRIIRKIAKFILASQPDAFVQVNVGQIQLGSILKDKKIVITGGGSGLGFAMAKNSSLRVHKLLYPEEMLIN